MTTFGLQLPNFGFGVPDDQMFDEVVARALAAEESGFGSLWVMDHFYQLPALGGADQPMLEAYTLLGALAARTGSVHLGALVSGVTYRNPAMLAKIVTTLDVVSRGRAVLGLGAAWHDLEHHGYGFEFPPVGERMDRLEDALQICRAMFERDHVTFEGRHHRTDDARNLPRPVQPGGPRILVGGGGERRTLRLVARYADACNLHGDPDTIRHKIEVLHGHCAEVGRDPAEVRVTRLATLVVTQSAQQTGELQNFLARAAGPEALSTSNLGQPGEVVEQIHALAEAGVEEFLFNMPLADPSAIRAAGDLFRDAFG
ncbi:MAG: LLM class F420-dependent oxidoreductase [Acidimicrobiales bacterium]|nr:LLM class F420-dependent oxidoreductase [Acidimicrobiales bacterium]MCB1017217.1 LLM class F420-dependent oxidoreductase [Acidimicrobiales bacterium]MCB9371347.1 LLM class F420-dependent oxidoreductase [Microthrixaceae bacterium]